MVTLKERLFALPHHHQIAFAAACAERVLGIFERLHARQERALHDALALAWRAAAGDAVPPPMIAAAIDAVRVATPEYDDGDHDATHVGIATISSLRAIGDDTGEQARRAAVNALESVNLFEKESGEGVAAEEAWQDRALTVLEAWGDQPLIRNMFNGLGPNRTSRA